MADALSLPGRLHVDDPVIYRRIPDARHPAFLVDGSVGVLRGPSIDAQDFMVEFEGYGVIAVPRSMVHLYVNLNDTEEVEAWLSHP